MTKAFLLDEQAVKQRLVQVFNQHRVAWLTGRGKWPLIIRLGLPEQKTALTNLQAVGSWIEHWRQWRGGGELAWCTRDWSALGKQQLPEKIIFSKATEVMQWLNQSALWAKVTDRYQQLTQRWPLLAQLTVKYYDVLATYSDDDFVHLQNVLDWFVNHPDSGIYLRQLPIKGIHTKWIETRKSLIFGLLRLIKKSEGDDQSFYQLAGLRREPNLVRMRLLDPELRHLLGGLSYLQAGIEEIAQLNLPVQRVYIVENLYSGLAFGDLPGTVVFIGLGNSVTQLSMIPWLRLARCYYWGDIDTHGFAILDRARSSLPQLISVLMDQATLLSAKPFWVLEDQPCRIENLPHLTADEREVYNNLRDNVWGYQIRLEQERIFWADAWRALVEAAGRNLVCESF